MEKSPQAESPGADFTCTPLAVFITLNDKPQLPFTNTGQAFGSCGPQILDGMNESREGIHTHCLSAFKTILKCGLFTSWALMTPKQLLQAFT